MGIKSEYVLTPRMNLQMRDKYGVDKCARCRQPFVIGDAVVHKRGKRGVNHRFLHKVCWERMFIDV